MCSWPRQQALLAPLADKGKEITLADAGKETPSPSHTAAHSQGHWLPSVHKQDRAAFPSPTVAAKPEHSAQAS